MWGGLLWLREGQLPGEAELDSLDPAGKETSVWSPGNRAMGQGRGSFHGTEEYAELVLWRPGPEPSCATIPATGCQQSFGKEGLALDTLLGPVGMPWFSVAECPGD